MTTSTSSLLRSAAVAGPLGSVIGISTTLILSGTISLICIAVIIAQPSVWSITTLTTADPVPEI